MESTGWNLLTDHGLALYNRPQSMVDTMEDWSQRGATTMMDGVGQRVHGRLSHDHARTRCDYHRHHRTGTRISQVPPLWRAQRSRRDGLSEMPVATQKTIAVAAHDQLGPDAASLIACTR